ncbi:MAG: hypothetical protein OQL06_14090 [Gammaproteobacteria bacterium]|nr:hypothetical protein [Gammaproteobacteria bacterium]
MKKRISRSTPIIISILLSACGSSDDAARIVLGTGNDSMTVVNGIDYQQAYSVGVTDAEGNGIGRSVVNLSYTTVSYIKGQYVTVDTDADGEDDQWRATPSITCAAEDINQNDTDDGGEDLDGDGVLEPTNSVVLTAHPSFTPTLVSNQIITDENGIGYFVIQYPKSEASWSRIILTAKTEVFGSEEIENLTITLPVLLSDAQNIDGPTPSGFIDSRYGTVADCTNLN